MWPGCLASSCVGFLPSQRRPLKAYGGDRTRVNQGRTEMHDIRAIRDNPDAFDAAIGAPGIVSVIV